MSSASLPWPLLYLFPPLPILAGQPSMGLMPTAVALTIPPCAQLCVQSFIANDFPTSICSSPQDLDCLCTKNGIFGFTLGEGGLRCVVTTCSDVDSRRFENEKIEAYNICNNIPNAKSRTHGTLTATKFSNPTGSSSTRTSSSHRSSSSSSRQSRSPTRSSSAVTRPTSHVTSTTVPTSRSTDMTTSRSITPRSATSSSATSRSATSPSATSRSSTTSSVLSSPSTAAQSSTIDSTSSTPFPAASSTQTSTLPVARPASALSKGQIAGVAVGGSVAALVFAAFLFFVLRHRRRRSNRRDSGSTFGGDDLFTRHPGSPVPYQRVDGQFEPNYRSRDSTQLESQEEQVSPIGVDHSPASPWRGSGQPEIGLALAPDTTPKPATAESPRSLKSSRTASRPSSRLLPDKPAYSLYPPPLRIKHSVSPESPGGGVVPGAAGVGQRGAMPLSKAAPRGRLSSDTSQVSLQPDLSIRQSSLSDHFLRSRSDPAFMAYARERSQNSQSEILTGLPSPEVLNRGQWTQSVDNLRKPVPARQSSSARTLTQQQATKASISPSDYTGRPFELPPQPTITPSKPVSRRKSAPRRPPTHYSSASDTSFEDAGDEDAIPTANPILSPVQESPATRSHRRQGTDPNILRSFSSPSERRPEPESPTRQPTRRRQPPTLVSSAAAPRPLKSSLKPLSKLPENPDSSTPLIPKMRGGQASGRAGTDFRGNPRRETESTAKWKILVGSGLRSIEHSGTPRSGRSSEWAPSTLTRRDA